MNTELYEKIENLPEYVRNYLLSFRPKHDIAVLFQNKYKIIENFDKDYRYWYTGLKCTFKKKKLFTNVENYKKYVCFDEYYEKITKYNYLVDKREKRISLLPKINNKFEEHPLTAIINPYIEIMFFKKYDSQDRFFKLIKKYGILTCYIKSVKNHGKTFYPIEMYEIEKFRLFMTRVNYLEEKRETMKRDEHEFVMSLPNCYVGISDVDIFNWHKKRINYLEEKIETMGMNKNERYRDYLNWGVFSLSGHRVDIYDPDEYCDF